MKKKNIFSKKFENFIRNILQQEIWIYHVKRMHNAQNHGLVHFDANYPPEHTIDCTTSTVSPSETLTWFMLMCKSLATWL